MTWETKKRRTKMTEKVYSGNHSQVKKRKLNKAFYCIIRSINEDNIKKYLKDLEQIKQFKGNKKIK